MKENRQLEMENIIASFGTARPRLLLHACCAPCSSAVLERIAPFFDVTLFYCNPNMDTREEYEKRASEFQKLLSAAPFGEGVKFIAAEYDHAEFTVAATGTETEREGGARCARCFDLRLEKTAEMAKRGGFDWFATTLTVSPHKNAELINTIGGEISEKYGVCWLPTDFKKKNGKMQSASAGRSCRLPNPIGASAIVSAA